MLNRRSRPNDSFPKLFGGSLYCRKSAFGKDYYCPKEPFGANLYLDGRAEMLDKGNLIAFAGQEYLN